MLRLNEADANRVSFPDCAVSEFTLARQRLAISTDGIFVEELGLLEGTYRIELLTNSSINVRIFDGSRWHGADHLTVRLRDLCEWVVQSCDLQVCGFDAQSGAWTEIVVPDFSATITTG